MLARDEVTSFPIRMQLCAAQSARVQPNSGLRVCVYVSASPSFHSFRIQSKGQLITQSTGVCVCVQVQLSEMVMARLLLVELLR